MTYQWFLGRVIVVGLLILGVLPPERLAAAEPKKVCLLVGVNVYEKRGLAAIPLTYAERDVRALDTELSKNGFTSRVLTGSDKNAARRATKVNIEAAIEDLLQGLKATDVVLIALAGHGQQRTSGGEEDAFYCPVDADKYEPKTMLSLTELMKKLDRKGGINLVLVDACRDDPTRSMTGNELNGKLPSNTAVLFSCAARQQALESEKSDGGHGLFTHSVLEGLRGKAADGSGEVDWDGLVKYVKRNVNREAVELFPDRAAIATGGELQTPHALSNLVAIPVLARLDVRPMPDRPKLVVRPMPMPEPPNPIVPLPDPSPAKAGEVVTNSLGMKLKLIPAGRFTMGSPESEVGHGKNETQVEVTLTKPFYMGTTTVTQGQWKQLMKTEPWKGKEYVKEETTFPATYVNWDDVQEFCKALSAKEGKKYRLPTEAEWEYACRAGTKTAYSFVGDESRLDDYAWFGNNAWDIGEKYAHEVGQKKPNAYGLYDMHGNVLQWCEDSYDEKLPGGSDPLVSTVGLYRVIRGGSSDCVPLGCRSGARFGTTLDRRKGSLGFRVALVPSDK